MKIVEGTFGNDINNFDITVKSEGRVFAISAVCKDEYRNVAGYLKVVGNTIVKLSVFGKADPSYELLKFVCDHYDSNNQPLMVDENAISIDLKRLLQGFGFNSTEDSLLMRRPYAVITLDFEI